MGWHSTRGRYKLLVVKEQVECQKCKWGARSGHESSARSLLNRYSKFFLQQVKNSWIFSWFNYVKILGPVSTQNGCWDLLIHTQINQKVNPPKCVILVLKHPPSQHPTPLGASPLGVCCASLLVPSALPPRWKILDPPLAGVRYSANSKEFSTVRFAAVGLLNDQ